MKITLTAMLAAASLLLISVPGASAAPASSAARPWCNEKHPSTSRYYYQHKNHWDCVGEHLTCSKKQRGDYGYSMDHAPHSRKLRCVFWSDAYRWKPVRKR
ncbi:hypothetical protein GCM10010404_68360 [Nonomuraea africana]|uniref:Uncharacterized protein n=1 Tax=Nonomuraea africana TaxID=46171 RepID=A0ABR9KNS5_9ACTN|nr:hypothetical protein [Nonomuraea africana]